MTDMVPKRKMNPVCDGKWAGIDVSDLLDRRATAAAVYLVIEDEFDRRESQRLGIDVASIRRLAGEK